MNIIQELIEKYNGEYSEESTINVNSPIGKYVYKPKSGIIELDGTKISINLNEVAGAMPVTEPFRITLHLDKTYATELSIFPIDSWNKFLNIILPKRGKFVPKSLAKQFWFEGNEKLIKQLAIDKFFCNEILNDKIYIKTGVKTTTQITLTPEYGIKDIKQLEKYVSVLKRIENKIKASHNNLYS